MQQFSSLEQFIVIVVVAHGLSLDSISSKMHANFSSSVQIKNGDNGRQWQMKKATLYGECFNPCNSFLLLCNSYWLFLFLMGWVQIQAAKQCSSKYSSVVQSNSECVVVAHLVDFKFEHIETANKWQLKKALFATNV
jgi:hypothetical protein